MNQPPQQMSHTETVTALKGIMNFDFDTFMRVGEQLTSEGNLGIGKAKLEIAGVNVPLPLAFLANLDAIRYVLTKADPEGYTAKGFTDLSLIALDPLHPFDKSLIGSSGRKWEIISDIARPYFSKPAVMKSMPSYKARAAQFVETLEPGTTINLHDALNTHILNQLLSDVLSYPELENDPESIAAISDALKARINYNVKSLTNPKAFMRNLVHFFPEELGEKFKLLQGAVDKIITNGRNKLEQKSLMTALISATFKTKNDEGKEKKPRINDRELNKVIIELLVAGHETTTNAIWWLLYDYSQRGELERLYEALRNVTLEEMMDNPTEGIAGEIAALMENYAQTPISFRLATEDIVIPIDDAGNTVTITKGTHILFLWQVALNEAKKKGLNIDRRKFLSLAFSEGPRICMGRFQAIQQTFATLKAMAEAGIGIEVLGGVKPEIIGGVQTPVGEGVYNTLITEMQKR